MKKTLIILSILSLIAIFTFAKQEKVLQIFRNGEVIQEYAIDDIDYIEVNDLIPAPENINALVDDNQITIKWDAVAGATYNIYRSPDNVNFSLLASNITETSYTDTKPLRGSNFYRIKAVIGDMESGFTSSAAAALASSELENGIYLGITGFNQSLYDYPIMQLTENSADDFRNFVDGLTMKNGTVLYYSVDRALNEMQSTELPTDISTAAIVTFTDGLDQGSFMMDGVSYDDEIDYLEALNNRIMNETISGQPITAYSIGIRGKDVSDINMFRTNLSKLASSAENATEVTSMAEVNAKFKEIAEQLSQSNYVQTINLKMPGLSNGTRVRFTFDNVNDANKSHLYIEGKFNLKDRSLEEIQYVGLDTTSGPTIKGTVDGIFVTFTFDGVHTENNVLIKSDFTDEWTYIASNDTWQINSEFDKTENSDIITERSSAVIMLVLDCSSSLADDFVKAQTNAKDFISTFYQAAEDIENPSEDKETIYSTTPQDLSVAVWKNGKRYYLTLAQYKSANLTNVTVEGLTILSNLGNFIISPNLIQSNIANISTAMVYYEDMLPDKNQASVISARYIDINNTLSSLGWQTFGTSSSDYYMTKTPYSGPYNYQIHLYRYTGGNLAGNYSSGYNETTCYVRGVVPITTESAILWKDPNDLKLSVIKDGKRFFISDTNEDLNQFDKIEGIYVAVGDTKFIVKLHNEQSGKITKNSAVELYSDILPSSREAIVISLKYQDINRAIWLWDGNELSMGSSDYYMTKTAYDSTYNYQIYLYRYTGGNLAGNHSSGYNETSGYIRGIIIP